jgi:hypothetical protein
VTPGRGQSESLLTVLVALGANLLIAVAKSVAAALTASASMTAEAAHSWADTGNELFLALARAAVGQEQVRLWRRMTALAPVDHRYTAASRLEIPVVVLERVGDAPATTLGLAGP